MPTLSEVVDLVHGWYPPGAADDWDAVGLVAGDGRDEVGAGDRIRVGNRRRHFNGDGHLGLLVERWLFGGPDGGAGLA